jgi:hypothetical protein
MEAYVAPPFENDFKLKGTVGSAESEPHSFTLTCKQETISSMYKDITDKVMAGTLTQQDRDTFVKKFLNVLLSKQLPICPL